MIYPDIVQVWSRQHPEWVGHGLDQAKFLYGEAMRSPDGVFVEIGTQSGGSAVVLAGAAEESGKILYCVDPYELFVPEYRKIERRFRSNMKDAGLSNWELLRGFSEDIAPDFTQEISLLYIDGNHVYDYVLKDWILWSPKVVAGGIVVFHDSDHVDVVRVLDVAKGDQNFHKYKVGPYPLTSIERKTVNEI